MSQIACATIKGKIHKSIIFSLSELNGNEMFHSSFGFGDVGPEPFNRLRLVDYLPLEDVRPSVPVPIRPRGASRTGIWVCGQAQGFGVLSEVHPRMIITEFFVHLSPFWKCINKVFESSSTLPLNIWKPLRIVASI